MPLLKLSQSRLLSLFNGQELAAVFSNIQKQHRLWSLCAMQLARFCECSKHHISQTVQEQGTAGCEESSIVAPMMSASQQMFSVPLTSQFKTKVKHPRQDEMRKPIYSVKKTYPNTCLSPMRQRLTQLFLVPPQGANNDAIKYCKENEKLMPVVFKPLGFNFNSVLLRFPANENGLLGHLKLTHTPVIGNVSLSYPLSAGVATCWSSQIRFYAVRRKDHKFPDLRPEDLEEEFVRGSGPGGQSVNKTSNCVVLKHIPTGTVVKCHETRSLEENRKRARLRLEEKLDLDLNGDESFRSKVKAEGEEAKKEKKRRNNRRLALKAAFKEKEKLD